MLRAFTKKLCTIFLFLSTGVAFANPAKNVSPVTLEKDYHLVSADKIKEPLVREIINKNPNKTVVLAFFNYGCYACSRVYDDFDRWSSQQQTEQVHIEIVPAVFDTVFKFFAQVYYTQSIFNTPQNFSKEIFNAIWNEHRYLGPDRISGFFNEYGISGPIFEKHFNSDSVSSKVKRAEDLTDILEVKLSPATYIIKDSKIYLTDLEMTKTIKRQIEVIDALVQQQL